MFDLTWLPDWLLVFAGLLIALGLIAFVLMPFAVLGVRIRIARLEEEVRSLQRVLNSPAFASVERRPTVVEGWHAPQGRADVPDMPWGCSEKNVGTAVEQRSAVRGGLPDVRSRAEPRLRWPPPK
ncbi:hypothetical protein [Neokomagataea thailandica]|uniref:hypothetical protein n=1 Tax=Neokomagataea TaxID=1223423 RepID=UPI000832C962|nr:MULTISPECIES: hypothetical protein [Neokomagataea]